MFDVQREATSKRKLVVVRADRDALIECVPDVDDVPTSWECGSGETRESTRERLVLGNPNDRLRTAYRLARERLEGATAELTRVASTFKRKRRWSDDGDALDVGRYLSGRDDYWSTLTRSPCHSRTVKIVVDTELSGGGSTEQFASIGARAAAAVDVLSAAGIASEVEVIRAVSIGHGRSWGAALSTACLATGKQSEGWYVQRVAWRDSADPLDEGTLATLGLPGLNRVHGFGLMDRTSKALGGKHAECNRLHYGGAVVGWPDDLLEYLAADVVVGTKLGGSIEQGFTDLKEQLIGLLTT